MKKFALGIAFILIAGLMIYLTKPQNVSQGITIENKESDKKIEALAKATPHTPMIESSIPTMSCSSAEINEQIKSLKSARNEDIITLSEQDIDKTKLRKIIILHLKDYLLADKIYTPPKKKSRLDFNQKIFQGVAGQKLSEELYMASFAGQSDKYTDRFFEGKLSPLDPRNADHRDFFFDTFAMGGSKETLILVDKFFSNNAPISINSLPMIMHSIKDTNHLQSILKRIENINILIEPGFGAYGTAIKTTAMDLALSRHNYEAAELLFEMGAQPNHNKSTIRKALDNIYSIENVPLNLLNNMLDRGFTFSNSAKAERLSELLAKESPSLSDKVMNESIQLKHKEDQLLTQMPNEMQSIIKQFQLQHAQLKKSYTDCLVSEKKTKPKIPAYQSINRKKIEAEIDQLIAQKVQYEQIIVTLSAQNKEAVEHGYKYLQRLRSQKLQGRFNSLSDMPPEFKTMIGYYKDGKWDQMVELMSKTTFDPAFEFSAASMIPDMIEKGAPESAIAAMAKISDKNDVKLLRRAQFNPTLLDKIAGYGFNLDAKDNSNKNLFYQSVKRGQTKNLEKIIGYGVTMVSDPYGYDPLDHVLRKKRGNKELLTKLAQLGFPITDHHQDYSLYLKTYYPKRYETLVESMPNLKAEGEWEPKTL